MSRADVRDEPEPLVALEARGQLTGPEADLARLFRAVPNANGLDAPALASVRTTLDRRGWTRTRPRRSGPLFLRIALATGAFTLMAAGATLAAHLAGLPLPFTRAPAVQPRQPSPPRRSHPIVAPTPAPPPPSSSPSSPPSPAPPARPAPRRRALAVTNPPPPPRAVEPPPEPAPALAPPPASALTPPPVTPLPPPATFQRTTPLPPRGPAALASEAALLQEALGHLRRERDGGAALAVLDRYATRHPGGVLAPEAARARADALFLLGRRQDARRVLDGLALEARGRDLELLVVRGELRATSSGARACAAAEADFDRALAVATAPLPLVERALHGRATCRARRGDHAGAARDRAEYQRRFPTGRFREAAGDARGL